MAALASIRRGLEWEHQAMERDAARCDAALDAIHGIEADGAGTETEADPMQGSMILGDVTINQHQGQPAGPAATATAGGADLGATAQTPAAPPATTPPPAMLETNATPEPAGTRGDVWGRVRAALLGAIGALVVTGAVAYRANPPEAPAAPPAAPVIAPPEANPAPPAPPEPERWGRRLTLGP